MQTFIEFYNFYKRFIRDFLKIIKSMIRLTKKNHFLMIINLLKNLQSAENQYHINFYFETFR